MSRPRGPRPPRWRCPHGCEIVRVVTLVPISGIQKRWYHPTDVQLRSPTCERGPELEERAPPTPWTPTCSKCGSYCYLYGNCGRCAKRLPLTHYDSALDPDYAFGKPEHRVPNTCSDCRWSEQ